MPVNPKLGHGELRHVLEDSRPDVILGAPHGALPATWPIRHVRSRSTWTAAAARSRSGRSSPRTPP